MPRACFDSRVRSLGWSLSMTWVQDLILGHSARSLSYGISPDLYALVFFRTYTRELEFQSEGGMPPRDETCGGISEKQNYALICSP